jgi:hypothetical protein
LYSVLRSNEAIFYTLSLLRDNGALAGKDYSQSFRRVKFYDEETNKYLIFLTNTKI